MVERASKPNSIALPSALDVNSRGQESIALNLRSAGGLETLLKLVEKADVIFEGNRPASPKGSASVPDVCLARNSKIIYGRMTGWGQTGPLANSAGQRLQLYFPHRCRRCHRHRTSAVPPLNLIGDFAGGSLFLCDRDYRGAFRGAEIRQGQVIDTAITDGSAHLMSMFYSMDKLDLQSPARKQFARWRNPHYDAYETADGKHVSVGPIEPQFSLK